MKRLTLSLALAAACSSPAHAEIPLGTVAGSDVAFEGNERNVDSMFLPLPDPGLGGPEL